MVTIMNVAAPSVKATPKSRIGPYFKRVPFGKIVTWPPGKPGNVEGFVPDPRMHRWGPRYLRNLK